MTTPGVDHVRIAANAVIVRGDNVLLVEFNDASGRHYNFPGGGAEFGETLEQAVTREAQEETGLKVAVERLLLVVESVGARNTNLICGQPVPWNELRFFFLCTPTAESPDARLPDLPDPNQIDVRWIPVASLPVVSVLPQISTDLIAALQALTTHPIIVPNPHP